MQRVEEVLACLAAEEEQLAQVLAGLDDGQWSDPSAAPGWTVLEVVLHLAQSEELVVASLAGTPWPGAPGSPAPTGGGGIDAVVAALVAAERVGAEPAAVRTRWESARRAALEALGRADPDRAVPWAATPLRPRTLATTRLAEHWAHALDIAAPFGIELPDTDRLRHIAWLGHRSLPYAFALAGEDAPIVRAELTAPGGERWVFGPDDAATRVTGPAGDFCRVGARRLDPDRSALLVDGPKGRRVLELLRNYAG